MLYNPKIPPKEELTPFNMMRQMIAERLAWSWKNIPHTFTKISVDASRLPALKAKFSDQLGGQLGLDSFFVWTAVEALKKYPILNSHCYKDDDGRYYYKQRDEIIVSLAVDTDNGLAVPDMPGLERKTPKQVFEKCLAIVEKARGRRLAMSDFGRGTFTVNNPGALGSEDGKGIINPPQVAMLSVYRSKDLAALPVQIAFDHRLLDLGPVSKFLAEVRRVIENFPEEI